MSKHDKVRSIEKLAQLHKPCLGICAGKHCAKAGTKHIFRAAQAAIAEAGLSDHVIIELTKCQDYCDDAPVLTVLPGEFPYIELKPQDVQQIVTEHVRDGKPVLSLLHKRMRKRLKREVE